MLTQSENGSMGCLVASTGGGFLKESVRVHVVGVSVS